ncbi:SurA N-terminal domain-containing protein [Coxiella-like endosymbiont of Rhipicephalus sanguineus]|uniref:SurA N-terminal domain-containing protein n=1 Tax=Coxiella-like endosymbiont of Rhipicephalus sanguineus TaxID=1955402 RepID=UPI00203D480F|nr:SurA N-terminal domain-containing protein [Coxiella-like endosymbiont of Rhipicephalus sanguineus]
MQYYLQFNAGEGKKLSKVNGEKITENELNQTFQCLQRAYSQKIRHSLTAI